ncbi:MAG TPA: hypothetical protein VK066_30190 [Chloroflexota bacterium]|nr:hypothetical protein [Chloroflexota bacterium]
MSRIQASVVLAGVVALGVGVVGPGWFSAEPVQASAQSPSPVAEAPAAPEPSAWQQQWQSLLRREDQLSRDERQVEEMAPRIQPNLVDRLHQGLELTRQRLARERQQLWQQQPASEPPTGMPVEPADNGPPPRALRTCRASASSEQHAIAYDVRGVMNRG